MVPGISFNDLLEATSPLRSSLAGKLRQKVKEQDTQTCWLCEPESKPESTAVPPFVVRGLRDRGLYSVRMVGNEVSTVGYSSWLKISEKSEIFASNNVDTQGIESETRLPKDVAKSLVKYSRKYLSAEELDGRSYLKAKNLRHGFSHLLAMNDGHTTDTEYLAFLGKMIQAEPEFLPLYANASVTPYVVEFICAVGDVFLKVGSYLDSLVENDESDANANANANAETVDSADRDSDSDSAPHSESDSQDDEEPHLLTILRALREKAQTDGAKGVEGILTALSSIPAVSISVHKVRAESSEVNFDATARVISALDELYSLRKDVDPLLFAEDMLTILHALERLNESRKEQ